MILRLYSEKEYASILFLLICRGMYILRRRSVKTKIWYILVLYLICRGSSVGKSVAFITLRSWVQFPPPTPDLKNRGEQGIFTELAITGNA